MTPLCPLTVAKTEAGQHPPAALSHNYPTASATVDKNDVTMLEDNGSANAEVPLAVKNTKGFDLPKTGDHGTWMYSLVAFS